jgi:trimethylamine--corrinoid protein Co-methyltransferase
MDMGAMGLALGAPEYSLVSAACAQMAARYKVPFRGGGGLTDAKVLDGQAGAESAWNLLLTLGEGADFILQAVGVLESFMCASFDKWLADEEILLKWARVARGLGPWPEDLAETMAQGREAGGFLKLKSTLKKFRSEYYRPTLADRRPFEAWKAAGRDYRAEAFARVAKRLEAYEEPTVEPESLAAMRAVMYRHGIDPDAKA